MVNTQSPRSKSSVVGPVIMFTVALVAGLVIVGFVEPGFFLSDDKENTATEDKKTEASEPAGPSADAPDPSARSDQPEKSDAPSGPSPKADPTGYLDTFLRAVLDRDLATIDELSCGEYGPDDTMIADLIDDVKISLSLDAETVRTTDSTIDGDFSGVEEERGSIRGLVGGREDDGTWCVDTFSWA